VKKQLGSLETLEMVESGEETAMLAIPVRDVKEKKCPHRFTLKQIIDFVNGNLNEFETKVLMAWVNSDVACAEDARELARSEGVEDAFIDKMGW
jgi:hypothetical protein